MRPDVTENPRISAVFGLGRANVPVALCFCSNPRCQGSFLVSHLATTDSLFFAETELSQSAAERLVAQALANADDGELFLEYRASEALAFDDGKLKTASYDLSQGFGLRAVAGETTGYAHSSSLSEDALRRAADTVNAVTKGYQGTVSVTPPGTNRILYG